MIFSCIIPVSEKDRDSKMLSELVGSIRSQDFDQEQIEILIETEGDSEQAKANGIRKAKGEYCAMFCADNLLMNNDIFNSVRFVFKELGAVGVYAKHYWHKKEDNSLNRYFSLIGTNDPIPFYLGKADRKPAWDFEKDEMYTRMSFKDQVPSLGDNGFFFVTDILKRTNLDHYYPMDAAEDIRNMGYNAFVRCNGAHVWHRTSDNLITFLIKRYKYARDLFCDRTDRRWKMVGSAQDRIKLFCFILCTITLIQPIIVSIRGYIRVRDWAWFYHPIVCWGFLITYGVLVCRNLLKSRFSSLLHGQRTYANV